MCLFVFQEKRNGVRVKSEKMKKRKKYITNHYKRKYDKSINIWIFNKYYLKSMRRRKKMNESCQKIKIVVDEDDDGSFVVVVVWKFED